MRKTSVVIKPIYRLKVLQQIEILVKKNTTQKVLKVGFSLPQNFLDGWMDFSTFLFHFELAT